jgi:hypothetical protein
MTSDEREAIDKLEAIWEEFAMPVLYEYADVIGPEEEDAEQRDERFSRNWDRLCLIFARRLSHDRRVDVPAEECELDALNF